MHNTKTYLPPFFTNTFVTPCKYGLTAHTCHFLVPSALGMLSSFVIDITSLENFLTASIRYPQERGRKIASLKRRKTDLIASDCIHRVHRLFSAKHEGSHCFLRGSVLPIKSSLSRSMNLKLCKSFSKTLTEIYAFPKITEH